MSRYRCPICRVTVKSLREFRRHCEQAHADLEGSIKMTKRNRNNNQEGVMQYRQGDVYLRQVSRIPVGAERVEADRLVLAEGEATGHAHVVLDQGAELYQAGFTRYLRITADGPVLVHDEHATIPLAPGDYQVVRQREYQPDEFRQVLD